MKGLPAGDAVAALFAPDQVGNMVHSSPDIEVKDFLQDGSMVRGVATKVDLEAGEPVIIATPEMQLRRPWQGERFNILQDDMSRLSFWLAEQSAKLKASGSEAWLQSVPPGKMKPEFGDAQAEAAGAGEWIAAYVRSLPTLEEYRHSGMPLLASDKDLLHLSGLPKLNEVSRFVDEERTVLGDDLAKYNEAEIGRHPKLALEDVLWGRTVVRSRAMQFDNCAPMALVPVGDMLNSNEHSSNVQSVCNTENGTMSWRASRHIDAGEELTQKFDLSLDHDPVEMVKHFGFAPESPSQQHWSEKDCSVIRRAGLLQSDSPLLKSLGTVAAQQCPGPGQEAATLGREISESSAPLPLLVPAAPTLPLRGQGRHRRVRTGSFLDVSLSKAHVA